MKSLCEVHYDKVLTSFGALNRDVCYSLKSIDVVENFVKIVVGCDVSFLLLSTFYVLAQHKYGYSY